MYRLRCFVDEVGDGGGEDEDTHGDRVRVWWMTWSLR